MRQFACFAVSFAFFFCLLAWLGYGLQPGSFVSSHKPYIHWIPLPRFYIEGLAMVWKHNAQGHENVFLMQNGFKGHAAYFPVAFLLKTPVPILLGILVGAYYVFRQSYPWRWIWLLFVGTYWLASMASNINLGVRHILPVLALMWVALAASVQASLVLRRWRRVTAFLFLWLIVASFANWGSELAYFNELVGSKNGWKYLGDSNVDWGHQTGILARFVQANGITPLYQDLFSRFPLAMYGIAAPSVEEGVERDHLRPGWYAISAHRLATRPGWTYDYFRAAEPEQTFGNSIFVYRVK